jgi:type IV pilus assembly protein PilP
LKLLKFSKFSFYLFFVSLLILVFVSKGHSEKNSINDLKPPTNDLPELNELPLDVKAKSPLPPPSGPEGNNPKGPSRTTLEKASLELKPIGAGVEKVEEAYQSYAKPEATADGYIYDPVGRRDPFRPYRDNKVGIGQLGVQRERPLEALENFDVKALEVVAIIWGISRPKALIEDPNKIIHTVVKGMRIGKNDGIVAEIREGEVVIVELFDQNGKVVKESFILPIRK